MLQKLRESLALLLLTLLPFHAFLVTVGTKLIAGPGKAPLPMLALWKEGVLGAVLLFAMVEFGAAVMLSSALVRFVTPLAPLRLRSGLLSMTIARVSKRTVASIDALDVLVISLGFLAIVVQLLIAPQPTGAFLLGAKYDLFPLAAFLILRRVPWSEWFSGMLFRLIIGAGVVISVLGIITLFLPVKFFAALGYADLHSLYDPGGPLAPFHQIGETWLRRVQSTMSGPNQLGIWLLLPLGFLLSFFSLSGRQRKEAKESAPPPKPLRLAFLSFFRSPKELAEGSGKLVECSAPLHPPRRRDPSLFVFVVLFLLFGAALFLTFSRAAWIGAFVMIVVALARILPKRTFRKMFLGILGIVGILGITVTLLFPSVFFRLSSSRGHLTRPLQAIGQMIEKPLGQGLGSAGPASNRTSEPCVILRPQDDPSWARSQPQLCVFLGVTQVQPLDHACDCPFLPENWYLQIGVELGVLGLVLFVTLVVLLLRRLGMENGKPVVSEAEPWRMENEPLSTKYFPFSIFHFPLVTSLFVLGVSLAALFLHAWEDAAVAYSGWILAAVALNMRTGRHEIIAA